MVIIMKFKENDITYGYLWHVPRLKGKFESRD